MNTHTHIGRYSILIFVVIISLVSLGTSIWLYREYAALTHVLQQVSSVAPGAEQPVQQPLSTPAADMPMTGENSWTAIQSKIRNSVVQIFSQAAAVDLLQPYRTPHQYPVTGTGFLINAHGEILTNAHVIDQAKTIWVQMPFLGKEQISVKLLGASPERDIALLKIEESDMKKIIGALGYIPFLTLGDSNLVRRADEIMTLGYPLGQQGLKSTVGVVSGWEAHFIQIDAPINPGNSGGPSLNKKGEVIGINTLYAPDAQNVGYIIPINEALIILDNLRTTKLLRKPFLGVFYNNASEAMTRYLNNPAPGGLYVVNVYKESPLHKAGVQKGDMIYEINGHRLDLYGDIQWLEGKKSIIDYVSELKVGQAVNLIVYRNGKRIECSFIFDQFEQLPIRKIYPGYEAIDYEIIAGLVLQPLTINHLPLLINNAPSLAKYTDIKYQLEPVVIISHVFPDSLAFRTRALGAGAIVKEINGVNIKNLADVRMAFQKSLDTSYVTLETADGVFIVSQLKEVLENDMRLSKNYFFSLSPTTKKLIEKVAEKTSSAKPKATFPGGAGA